MELDGIQWSYDPREGYAINNPSLVNDYGHYECLAYRITQYENRNQTVSFFLIVQRKLLVQMWMRVTDFHNLRMIKVG